MFVDWKKTVKELNLELTGKTVILFNMEGEKLPSGLKGLITHVDDAKQIHVNWSNGSTLALQEIDSFEVKA